MKKLFSILSLCLALQATKAQTAFIKEVTYRGAFAPAPTTPWTDGWTNWDPKNTVYPTANVTVSGTITSNTTWTSNNVYLLSGPVYVKNGATLTIQAGTVILGDASVANSSLIITKGAKISAIGTAASPIVFTSSKPVGERAEGNWGGIILLGKAKINTAAGFANIEGLAVSTDTEYGGTDDDDNSGNLKYVRIEFGGYIFETDKEINGLTFGGVGRNTSIDYVQCSYTNDDSFEWFGGTVNCAHLVAYRGVDDDFDTDFGFSGSVQFGLAVRDPQLSDLSAGSTSEGFESDNDATGSNNSPKTSAVFSNITVVGPYRGNLSSSIGDFKRAVRIRRNSNLKVFNSIFTEFPIGVFMDGTAVRANLASGATKFKNNLFSGNAVLVESSTPSTLKDSIFSASIFKNDSVVSTTDVLETPFDYTSPDYRPKAGSKALQNVDFTDAAFTGRLIVVTAANFIKQVTYRGAFAPAPAVAWTDGWANWDPKNTVYPATTTTVSGEITTNTTWTKNNVYLLSGPVYVKNGATLTIEAGTVIRGNASVANSSLIITKGSKINAVGTAAEPIVFTSNKAVGERAEGNWGGIILLGRAAINSASGTANIEGLAVSVNTEYGGGATPNDDDNSGTMKYVRIEFGGYIFETDKEINGLTFGGVGRGTTIDHIQCSYTNDDSFEWFGGTVNCSHLIAYRGVDDDFDTDFGFSGSVQFGLSVRDPQLSDLSAGSTSEGFESDNDATGSTATPQTKALFTNITVVGPYRGNLSSSIGDFKRAARIRRNSALKVFNSVFTDFPIGIFVDGSAVRNNLKAGTAKFKNNLFAGNAVLVESGTASTLKDSLFSASVFKNDSIALTTSILTAPFSWTSPDFRPIGGSLATQNVDFTDAAFTGLLSEACASIDSTPITGVRNVIGCVTNQTYTAGAMSGAVTYTWTVPTGVTIVSGQGTRSITVAFGSKFLSGTLRVVGANDCGNTATSRVSLFKTKLVAPAAITGTTNLCEFTTTATAYSIPAVAGAATYTWSVLGDSGVVVSQSANNANIRFNNVSFGVVRVEAAAGCMSVAKTLVVKRILPKKPGVITGATEVCDVLGTSQTFSISPVALATSYTWNLPTGATLVSATGTTATINFDNSFVSKSAIGVQANAGCGSSAASILKIAKTLPKKPGAITLSSTDVCGAILNGTQLTATIAPVAGATGYTWTLPTGVSLVSQNNSTANAVVTLNNSFVSATAIAVRADRLCGSSANAVAVLKINKPTGVTTVFGPKTVAGSASGVVYTASSVTNATRYTWVLPVGVTLVSANTDSSSITVNFSSTYKTASFSVTPRSLCGAAPTVKVAIARGTVTAAPSAAVGNEALTNEVVNAIQANVYPNPSTGAFVVNIKNADVTTNAASVQVINIYGQTVASYKTVSVNGNIQLSINNNSLTNGLYTIKYTVGNTTGTTRVMIQK